MFKQTFKNKYLANASILLVEKSYRLLSSLFVGILIGRYLGPENYGSLTFAQSLVAIFSVLSVFGMDDIVTKKLVDKENHNIILGSSFVLKFLGAILTILISLLFINISSNNLLEQKLVFIISLSTLFQSFNVVEYYYKSKVLTKKIIWPLIISITAVSIYKLSLIIYQKEVIYFAYSNLLESFIISSGILFVYFKEQKKIRWVVNFRKSYEILKEGIPLLFSGIAVLLFLKIDIIMVKIILGEKYAGLYSVSSRISEIWIFISLIISQTFMPVIFKYKNNISEYNFLNIFSFKISLIIALISSFITYLFSYEIIKLTYGIEFMPSADILKVYVWSNSFIFLNNNAWSWFISNDKKTIAFIKLIIALLLNVVLNLILIDQYKLIGAAISTIFSYAFAGVFGNILFKSTRKLYKLQVKAIKELFNINKTIDDIRYFKRNFS